MKILYKNLIDPETGKNIVMYLPPGIDRRKYKKEQRKIEIKAKISARKLLIAFN